MDPYQDFRATLAGATGQPVELGEGGVFRPYVISWNITKRCNLACSHCYIDAVRRKIGENELDTEQCFRIADSIAESNPGCLVILTGGEPLMREDIFDVARRCAKNGLFTVMGTNGVMLNADRVARAKDAGVRGFGISIDSIAPNLHDDFRGMPGAWQRSMDAIAEAKRAGMDVLVQTSLMSFNFDKLEQIVRMVIELGVPILNIYYLVCTGRGQGMSPLKADEYERSLHELYRLQEQYRGQLMINAKCAPHYKRIVHQNDPESTFLKTYDGGCPAATHYARITPEGKLTPCPYMPTEAGDLTEASFAEIWRDSAVLKEIRGHKLGGKCGNCEYTKVCGGCRARALALKGDYMKEDPWCGYEPKGTPIIELPRTEAYGKTHTLELSWTPEALARMDRIPSFARGMVTARVEKYCKENGITEVTPELMHSLREKMAKGTFTFLGRGLPFFKPKA
jgi:radical SAM protein with 4Fe4S-binding SPASM domain